MTRPPAADAATILVVAATDVAAVRGRTGRARSAGTTAASARGLKAARYRRASMMDGSGRIPNERFDCNVNLIFVEKMVLSQDILLGKLDDIARISTMAKTCPRCKHNRQSRWKWQPEHSPRFGKCKESMLEGEFRNASIPKDHELQGQRRYQQRADRVVKTFIPRPYGMDIYRLVALRLKHTSSLPS